MEEGSVFLDQFLVAKEGDMLMPCSLPRDPTLHGEITEGPAHGSGHSKNHNVRNTAVVNIILLTASTEGEVDVATRWDYGEGPGTGRKVHI